MLVRPARPGDEHAVASVHVRSWQSAYRGLLPADYLDGLRPEDRSRVYRFGTDDPAVPFTVVAVDDDRIVGFATTAAARDDDVAGMGELCALYVDPPFWSHGLGLALVTAARERLTTQGFEEAVLWVLVGNDRAERFYRTNGWNPDGSRRLQEIWGVKVDEIRYRTILGDPEAGRR
jgi:GNAT superfamily N-acetyltransferase